MHALVVNQQVEVEVKGSEGPVLCKVSLIQPQDPLLTVAVSPLRQPTKFIWLRGEDMITLVTRDARHTQKVRDLLLISGCVITDMLGKIGYSFHKFTTSLTKPCLVPMSPDQARLARVFLAQQKTATCLLSPSASISSPTPSNLPAKTSPSPSISSPTPVDTSISGRLEKANSLEDRAQLLAFVAFGLNENDPTDKRRVRVCEKARRLVVGFRHGPKWALSLIGQFSLNRKKKGDKTTVDKISYSDSMNENHRKSIARLFWLLNNDQILKTPQKLLAEFEQRFPNPIKNRSVCCSWLNEPDHLYRQGGYTKKRGGKRLRRK